MAAVCGGLRARVDAELAGFLTGRRAELDAIDPALTLVSDALEAFVLGGGKRLRPAFAYWAYLGSGGAECPELLTAIGSLELLHAGALIHDDVMDASDTRRGEPAVHRRFAATHAGAVWAGEPETFGRSAAILLGDLCLVWSDEMFSGSGMERGRIAAARRHFDGMRTEVMAGQYLDVLSQARGDTSVAQATKVARYKSASYTVERPLLLGGALAGAAPPQLEALSGYGLRVGEAFQLRDDILGVYGDPSQTGKPAGGDLREGKRTYLIAAAVEAGDERERTTLLGLLGDPELTGSGVAQLQAVINNTGALARTEKRIAELTSAALITLESAPLTPGAVSALRALATASAHRAT